jgi:hypothetical protein
VVACARARSSQVFLVLCGAQVAMPTTRTFNADGFTYEALLSRASFLPLSVLLAALGSIASARENIQVAKQLGMHMVLPGDENALAFPSSSLQTALVAAFKADANEGIFVFDADFGAHHMTFY